MGQGVTSTRWCGAGDVMRHGALGSAAGLIGVTALDRERGEGWMNSIKMTNSYLKRKPTLSAPYHLSITSLYPCGIENQQKIIFGWMVLIDEGHKLI